MDRQKLFRRIWVLSGSCAVLLSCIAALVIWYTNSRVMEIPLSVIEVANWLALVVPAIPVLVFIVSSLYLSIKTPPVRVMLSGAALVLSVYLAVTGLDRIHPNLGDGGAIVLFPMILGFGSCGIVAALIGFLRYYFAKS